MITKWYKNLLKWVLPSGVSAGYTPVKNTAGATKYMGGSFTGFPNTVAKSATTSSNAGIWLGKGQTAATEEDYTLEDKITSGITFGTATVRNGVDENENPYIEYTFMISNTTADDITIREIGYVQSVYLSSSVGGSSSSDKVMLDRTVLSTPVTVPANGEAVIRYTLKTVQLT